MKKLVLLTLVISSLVACSPSTEIVKSWKEPGGSVTPGPTNKALIVAMVKDETSRRLIEDQLAQRISAASPAIASYTLLTSDMMKAANDEVLNKMLAEGKFTHIVLMRLADIEKETSYVPGSSPVYYGSYGRYYGYGAGAYSSPGYYTTDKNYFIETTIYSVTPDKLLWTATTKTVNPSKIDKTVNAIADVVSAQMKKDGFLK
jgi:hypothetical protein